MWKDLGSSLAGVAALALLIGLVFAWLYPQVELTPELGGLFVLIALPLRWACGRLWALLRPTKAGPAPTPPTPPGPSP